MAVKDLQPRQGKVNIQLDIVEKSDIRTFNKFGKEGRVCNVKAKDDTGTVTLSLWNDEIDTVNVGDKVEITNGYVSEWQGEMQLSAGKFGELKIVGKSDSPAEATEAQPKQSAPSGDPEHSDSEDMDIQEFDEPQEEDLS
jgi:replication factor A1